MTRTYLVTSKAIALVIAIALLDGRANAVTITALGDTYISSDAPSSNYGPSETLRASRQAATLLSFPLTALPANIQSTSIAKATLQLWVKATSSNTSGTVSIFPITTSWSGASVTYNTRPSFGPQVASKGLISGGANYYLEIDVTNQIKSLVSSGQTTAYLAINSTGDVLFDSKENTGTSHAPLLDITLATPSGGGQTYPVCASIVDPDPFIKHTCPCNGTVVISQIAFGPCYVKADLGDCSAYGNPKGYPSNYDHAQLAICCSCTN